MKTNPSAVFLLQKIDTLNASTNNNGTSEQSVLEGIDPEYVNDAKKTLKDLLDKGVIEIESTSKGYKLTGNSDKASEEVKHYVKNRKIPH